MFSCCIQPKVTEYPDIDGKHENPLLVTHKYYTIDESTDSGQVSQELPRVKEVFPGIGIASPNTGNVVVHTWSEDLVLETCNTGDQKKQYGIRPAPGKDIIGLLSEGGTGDFTKLVNASRSNTPEIGLETNRSYVMQVEAEPPLPQNIDPANGGIVSPGNLAFNEHPSSREQAALEDELCSRAATKDIEFEVNGASDTAEPPFTSGVSPRHLRDDEYRVEVQLDTNGIDGKLGLDVNTSLSLMVVESIRPRGQARLWNETHKEKIRAGDQVMSVNDFGAHKNKPKVLATETMRAMCKSEKVVFVFRRRPPTFVVDLRRQPGMSKLGLKVSDKTYPDALTVVEDQDILSDTTDGEMLVTKWNKDNPSRWIVARDKITKVGDVLGTSGTRKLTEAISTWVASTTPDVLTLHIDTNQAPETDEESENY